MTEQDEDEREAFGAAIGADTHERHAKTIEGGGPTSIEIDLETKATPTGARKSELPVYGAQELPARLGRYTLTERLGAGGMAEIFLAEQGGLGNFKKKLVIKRMHPHLAQDERYVDMFLREAQIVADLNHTNIVQIYELGEERGNVFIAMEFVDGLSLYQVARRAWKAGVSMPMELAIYAIADAAQGLHHA
jgi:serine/threonine-protein kinase